MSKPLASGQQHVEQHEVAARGRDRGERGGAVGDHVRLHAFALEHAREERGHVGIVVDHQHAERALRERRAGGRRAARSLIRDLDP